MKIKHKGKVHPSPSSSPSSSSFGISCSAPNRDTLSVLNLLPAAILALASILSVQDREVLAYMIARSMKTTTSNPSSVADNDSKKKCKKPSQTNIINVGSGGGGCASHKPPLFDCDCFDCYTCYWFRWDSSPNRELIHQAIEAFEDHLAHGEQSKKINGRGKRKEKLSRRVAENPASTSEISPIKVDTKMSPEMEDGVAVMPSEENDSFMVSPEKAIEFEVVNKEKADVDEYIETTEDTDGVTVTAANNHHKAMARKVLPDVLSLFNSRLWNLWSPNV